MRGKIEFSVDKGKWQTSPLPGHIVLITTIGKDKTPNVAPKSWFSMVASKPAVIGFGCNLKHRTSQNILETREFVVNVPGEDLVEKVWKAGESRDGGIARVQKLGFTLIPSLKVSVPRIQECKAHLECVYESDRRYGDEIWIFGKVISVSIDEKALKGSAQQRYKYLSPIFYLEEKTYGALGNVKTILRRS